MESVLITGGTGLIGRHLVSRLLARGYRVRLLLRPGASERRRSVLEGIEAEAASSSGELELAEGDVTRSGLGVADPRALLEGVTHVFHLAALYDLTAPVAELERTNVRGTEHLLEVLERARFAGVLHHVSSIAVAGDHRGPFREADLEVGQSHPHAYHRTKLESEKHVRESTGVRFRIYRPGAVVGHSRTGEMDRIDGPYYAFKPLRVLRDNVPRWVTVPLPVRGMLPLAPVDFVADAIDHLAHLPDGDGRTFHVFDPASPDIVGGLNLLSAAAGGPRFKRIRVPGMSVVKRSPVVSAAAALGTLKFLRSEVLDDLDVPLEAAGAGGFEAELDTANLRWGLQGSGIECPPAERYVPVLWDWWLRHLDPDRDPEERKQSYLEGRRVLVTGASSGIGAALAEQCAALGAEVVLVARRDAELGEVAGRIRASRGRATHIAADLSTLEECDRVIRQVLEEHGPVDVLVNNAAHSIRRTVAESLDRYHDLERLMQLNYFAAARLIRGFLPAMRERGFGHVVNALTAGARIPSPRFGAYTASKIALGQLAETLGAELLHEGIRVTNAYLPWVRTPMMEATGKYDDTPAMTPDQAASWILEAVAAERPHALKLQAQHRFVAEIVMPRTVRRLVNAVFRIYADDRQAHPEFELDRALLQRLVPGRLV